MTFLPADIEAQARDPDCLNDSQGQIFRLSPLLIGIFSGPAVPLGALALPLGAYLPHFYAAQMGIGLASVGAIFFIVRLLDMGIDPILGVLLDRTRTRFGRFRPWMAVAIPLLMFATLMVFMPPEGATAPYLIGFLILLYVSSSMAKLCQFAWGGMLAGTYHERSRLYGWIQAGTTSGMIFVLLLPVAVARNEAAGLAAMGWFVIILTPITIALMLWRVREPARHASASPPAPLREYLRALRRPAVMRVLGCSLLFASALGVTGATFLFFFNQAWGFTPRDTSLLLVAYLVGGFIGAPLWGLLAKAIGKHRSMMAGCAYYCAMQGLTLLLPRNSIAIDLPVTMLTGIAFATYLVLLPAMTADVCDEAKLDDGHESSGMIYAMQNGVTKIGGAIGVAITFPLLQTFGFLPGAKAHNTPLAIHGLELTYVLLPMVFVILAGFTMAGYRLTEAKHHSIRAALAARAIPSGISLGET